MHLSITVGENLLAVGTPEGPPPQDLARLWHETLGFELLSLNTPAESRGEDGVRRPVSTEWVQLYKFDTQGRINCGLGYLERIQEDILRLGHTCVVAPVELPPERRPDVRRYDPDWDLLFSKGLDFRHARQQEALTLLEAYDRCLLNAPPGFGKTWLFKAYCVTHPRTKVHIVADGLAICNRIFDDLARTLPRIGMVGGGRKTWGQYTVVSADSVQLAEFHDPSSKRFADTVLCDEVHLLAAPNAWNKLLKYRLCKMFGVSANVMDRFDNASQILESIFGRVHFNMTYQEAQESGLVTPIEVEWIDVPGDDVLAGLEDACRFRRDLFKRTAYWENKFRNAAIIRKVDTWPAEEQGLILVETIEHLLQLKRLRPDLQLAYGAEGMDEERYNWAVREGILHPERDPLLDRKKLRELQFRFERGEVLRAAANKVWDTGVDFVNLEHLFIAHGITGRIAGTQGPGRVSRINSSIGKVVGKVYDCYDRFNQKTVGRSQERKRTYTSHGWTSYNWPTPRRGEPQ